MIVEPSMACQIVSLSKKNSTTRPRDVRPNGTEYLPENLGNLIIPTVGDEELDDDGPLYEWSSMHDRHDGRRSRRDADCTEPSVKSIIETFG